MTEERPGEGMERHDDERDRALIRALARGDRRALAPLVERHGRRLYALALHILGRSHDAEEALQESFVKIATRAETYRGDGPVAAWLHRLTSRMALTTARRRKRRLELEGPAAGDLDALVPSPDETRRRAHLDDPARSVQRKELVERVRAGLDRLGPEQRTAFVLRVFHGLSYREIAETCDCSLGTVQSRIARAREILRAFCDHEPEAGA